MRVHRKLDKVNPALCQQVPGASQNVARHRHASNVEEMDMGNAFGSGIFIQIESGGPGRFRAEFLSLVQAEPAARVSFCLSARIE